MDLEALFARALHLHRHDTNRLHHDAAQAHEMFQTAPISALLQGVYDGETRFADLARHGDFGLGTLNALDGEMVALEGVFYQITMDGRAHVVPPEAQTPFAVVTFFQPDRHLTVEGPVDWAGLQARLDAAVPTKNVFYAVRIDGVFDRITTRSVPRQARPYPPLVEVTAHQSSLTLENVRGTLAGFRFPDYTSGLNVPGYHLHFLTEDRQRGGHLLDCRARDLRAAIDHSSDLHLELPEDAAFAGADLSADTAEALRRAEQGGGGTAAGDGPAGR